MGDYERDEALARLRAADPARGSAPDLDRVRRTVDRRLSAQRQDDASGYHFAQSSDLAVRVHERQPRTWRLPGVAAAAAVALGVGAGGFSLGQLSAEGPATTVAGGTQTPAEGDRPAEGGGTAEEPAPDGDGPRDSALVPGAAPGEDVEAEVGAADEAYGGDADIGYGGFGPFSLVPGPGLSTERTTGTVTARQAPDLDPEEALTAWADGLGLEGEVRDLWGSPAVIDGFVMVSVHGSGSSLSFDYQNMVADPSCSEMVEAYAQERAMAESGELPQEDADIPYPAAEDCLPTPTESPAKEDAVSQVRQMLEAGGLDPADFEFEAVSQREQMGDIDPETMDDPWLNTVDVMGTPVGEPTGTGPGVNAQVSTNGVTYLNASLSESVVLGEYPVISAVEAVERWADPVFSSGGGGFYIPEELSPEDGTSMPEGWEWVEPEPLTLTPGEPLPFPVEELTVTEAILTTGVLDLPGASGILAPGYVLVTSDGQRHHVLGLAEEALDLTP